MNTHKRIAGLLVGTLIVIIFGARSALLAQVTSNSGLPQKVVTHKSSFYPDVGTMVLFHCPDDSLTHTPVSFDDTLQDIKLTIYQLDNRDIPELITNGVDVVAKKSKHTYLSPPLRTNSTQLFESSAQSEFNRLRSDTWYYMQTDQKVFVDCTHRTIRPEGGHICPDTYCTPLPEHCLYEGGIDTDGDGCIDGCGTYTCVTRHNVGVISFSSQGRVNNSATPINQNTATTNQSIPRSNKFVPIAARPEFCGNGRLDEGEECDEGLGNGYASLCSEDCKKLDRPKRTATFATERTVVLGPRKNAGAPRNPPFVTTDNSLMFHAKRREITDLRNNDATVNAKKRLTHVNPDGTAIVQTVRGPDETRRIFNVVEVDVKTDAVTHIVKLNFREELAVVSPDLQVVVLVTKEKKPVLTGNFQLDYDYSLRVINRREGTEKVLEWDNSAQSGPKPIAVSNDGRILHSISAPLEDRRGDKKLIYLYDPLEDAHTLAVPSENTFIDLFTPDLNYIYYGQGEKDEKGRRRSWIIERNLQTQEEVRINSWLEGSIYEDGGGGLCAITPDRRYAILSLGYAEKNDVSTVKSFYVRLDRETKEMIEYNNRPFLGCRSGALSPDGSIFAYYDDNSRPAAVHIINFDVVENNPEKPL